MDLLTAIDAVVRGRALLFGSLPPGGRDLDLLVQPEDERLVTEELSRRGFRPRGVQWVRFEGCSVESIDVVPATDWSLPPSELQVLLTAAVRIDGTSSVVRPAPHHALLILARQFAGGDGSLAPKRRARIDEAVREDPRAWERAAVHAPLWGAIRALRLLEAVYSGGRAASILDRVAARAELLRHEGAGARQSWPAAFRMVCLARRRGLLVAFSGLQGSGRSTHAEALGHALLELGMNAVYVQSGTPSDSPFLDAIPDPVKRWLERSSGDAARPPRRKPGPPRASPRRRSAVAIYAGAALMALAIVLTLRRCTRPHLRAGRIVVCDRYTLDAAVRLRQRYGDRRPLGSLTAGIRLLSPRPLRCYLLEVPPEVALDRTSDRYGTRQIRTQSRLYLEEQRRLDLERLDGLRPREELCEEVAREVWDLLG